VTLLVAFALSYGLLMIAMAADSATNANVSLCILPNGLNGFAKQAWIMLNALVCLCVLIVYIVASRLVHKKKIERGAGEVHFES
jgi:hypothetical protein